MKVENMYRAIAARVELERLDDALSRFDALDLNQSIGIVLAQHEDKSGFFIGKQYLEGNHHPMYCEIIQFAHDKFIEAREDLLKEIEEL